MSKKLSKKPKMMYVVLHCEIMGGFRDPIADEMVFNVASSLKKAEKLIQGTGVDPYSWWQVISLELDDPMGDFTVEGYYTHKGKRIKNDLPPYEKALAMYKKCWMDPKHHLHQGCCSRLTDKLFPNLPKGTWCYFSLSEETKLIVEAMPQNPFLDPHMQENFVQAVQRQWGARYSWGGYLEDRTVVMTGQYQKPGEVIHRGVDYNVPINTEVSVPVPGKLVYSYQDPDQNGGWGGKLVFEPAHLPFYFILGHLKDIVTELDRVYKPGEIVGKIAEPRLNGNWYPHLHVQCVRKEFPNLDMEVDGYGAMYKGITKDFPNPEDVLCIQAVVWRKKPKGWKKQ